MCASKNVSSTFGMNGWTSYSEDEEEQHKKLQFLSLTIESHIHIHTTTVNMLTLETYAVCSM